MVKITVRTSARVRVYPVDAVLPIDACCWLEKRQNKFRFPVFNPQAPQAPRALRAKLREEEGFSGLVPLVTHPSSIPLLGCLTPKFLSLSLHSL
jgi:hypothetical protein